MKGVRLAAGGWRLAAGGWRLAAFAFACPSPVTQPERSSRRAKKAEKLSEGAKRASFFPPARRLFRGGYPPQAGKERGAFFCLLFYGVKKE